MTIHTISNIPVGTPSSMTDTQWRAYITALCDGMDAVGFTRSSDTGQFDPTTVARPTTATYSSYEVRKLVAPTDTYYVKIEHNSAGFRVTLAMNTDGSGGILGNKAQQTAGPSTTLDSSSKIRFTKGGRYAGVVINRAGTTYGFVVGEVDGTGLLTMMGRTDPQTQFFIPNSTTGTWYTNFFFSPGYPTNPPDPNYAPIFRAFAVTGSALPQEVPYLVVTNTTAANAYVTFQAAPYGEMATWLKTAAACRDNNYVLCVRFDDA